MNTSSNLHVTSPDPRALWIGGAIALIALWFGVYWQLPQFSDWVVSHLPLGDWRIGAPFYFCGVLQAAALILAVMYFRKVRRPPA